MTKSAYRLKVYKDKYILDSMAYIAWFFVVYNTNTGLVHDHYLCGSWRDALDTGLGKLGEALTEWQSNQMNSTS